MNSDEINKYVHEQIMGEPCWHAWNKGASQSWCGRCEATVHLAEPINPAYAQSLDLIAPVEAKVIEKVGVQAYAQHLVATAGTWPHAVSATAEQRAKACVAAYKKFTEG